MPRPNVLLVCTDQQRPDWFSPTGLPLETPNAEALGERGAQFTNAVCPTPVCNPCRASLASGMEYDRCGVPNNELDYPVDGDTLYRRLRDEAGYHVAGTGKFDLTTSYRLGDSGVPGDEWGFSAATFTPAKNETVSRVRDGGEPQGPYTAYLESEGLLETHVEDYRRRTAGSKLDGGKLVSTFPTSLPQEAYYDEWITRQGQRHIREAPDDRPWFVQVNLQNPHDPWDITEDMHGRFRDPDIEFPEPVGGAGPVDPETHQEVRRNYAAMVEHLDDMLGRLVETVERRGERGNTVVVFCSDHGEMLGDHGQWQKDSPLRAASGVPLVIDGPDVASRGRVEAPATILDIHATVLDYAGLDTADVDSKTMRPFLAEGADQPREAVYTGLSTWRRVSDGRFTLVRGYDPDRRQGPDYEPRGIEPAEVTRLLYGRDPVLYDHERGEEKNVADEHPDVVERLTAHLEDIRGRPEQEGYGWGGPA